MAVVTIMTKSSYWDVLPLEIQDLIIEQRDKILFRERQELLRSLSLQEVFKALDYKYCDMLAQCAESEQIRIMKLVSNSVHKVTGRIFRVSSYDITDVIDGLNLAINVERQTEDNEQPEDPIVRYWDEVDEVQQGVDAAECFDDFNVADLERALSRDEDEFIHFAGYCLDVFRNIYNNRVNN